MIQKPKLAKATLTVHPFLYWGFSVEGKLEVSYHSYSTDTTYRKAAAKDKHCPMVLSIPREVAR